jgi:glycosyltransferase involved in cell wall biosynthesis
VGILFPPGDSNALADAIIYLLQNERVREKMGNNAKERTKYYNWDNIAYELEQIYKQIMCSKGR